ncbi:hypothetical protein Lal_00032702 [Lupinus albus]|nr:hypothetical protein Lal_00032702 [Lupinus albus]
MVMSLLRRGSFFRELKLSSSLSCVGNNATAEIAQLSILQSCKRKKLEELSLHDDGTREFIMQLEKPIKKIDFIDLVNIDDDNSDVKPLNLALQL